MFTFFGSTISSGSPPLFPSSGSADLDLIISELAFIYKRLEKQRFYWPDWFDGETLCLTQEQLDQLEEIDTRYAAYPAP